MFDGVFIHYLVNELKQIQNLRINKFGTINQSEFFLTLSNKKTLLISINSNNPNIRLTNIKLLNSPQKNNFQVILKKYLESSIIQEISQYQNDRIIIIKLIHFDDLGYEENINMIIEYFGRNSNLILTQKINDNDIIIDAYKRVFANSENERMIVPKGIYSFPTSDKVNPYTINNNCSDNNIDLSSNIYQGISNLLFTEISIQNNFNIIHSECKPVLIKSHKLNFYAFDLTHIEGERMFYNSLSELLDVYFTEYKNNESINNEQTYLKNYISKEIIKIKNKLHKQKDELEKAINDLIYEKIGNLFISYMYLSKKGDTELIVEDFYDNNNKFKITLNPLLTPNQNAEYFFKRYQKAKRAEKLIKEQIEKSQNDINYYECLLNQLQISKITDIIEIYQELNIKIKALERPKKSKPNITKYQTINNDFIWVGKNNIQNNYLTNEFAKKTDYFFHVQNVPGSHVILRTENLTEDLIYLTGCIAALNSSYKGSTNVCVDYTLVKNVKKIPGQKGSFVTYKNQKSVFGKPDEEYINKYAKIVK